MSNKLLRIALPKGRIGEKAYDIFERLGLGCPEIRENSRKLIFTNEENKVCYFWAKPTDVPVYVERGAADIGVVGKDILSEYGSDIYELLDIGFGKCRMCVSGYADTPLDIDRTLTVATKFPHIANEYFESKSREIDIIKLNGSIEIAPILGLSDVIVDIVETGKTLYENNLCPLEDIFDISARLIVNKSSYKFESARLEELCVQIRDMLKGQSV